MNRAGEERTMLGRKVGKDVQERYRADQELAATYQDRVDAAAGAEEALRHGQTARLPDSQLRVLSVALDRALNAALLAAEASERVVMGPKAYPGDDPRSAEIAARKARATSAVQPWTDEVDRLRTAKEANLLGFRAVARV
jgi:hypothetical protein